MQNITLSKDYFERAKKRLIVFKVLLSEKDWPDVVREAQELVELALKALLRSFAIEVPRIHDVSNILEAEASRFPSALQKELELLMKISRELRRDRELAFYGSEDLTPLEFYKEGDAKNAFEKASKVIATLEPYIK